MKPFLLIDVDGPLNPYAAKATRRPDGYETHRMTPGGWDSRRMLRVWLNPNHGRLLLDLPFELIWATTWMGEANEWIGPNIGLPELPFIDFPNLFGRTEDGTYWKTHDIVEWADGRSFAWIDDEIKTADREYVTKHHKGDSFLHYVDPSKGLLFYDFDTLRKWAKHVS